MICVSIGVECSEARALKGKPGATGAEIGTTLFQDLLAATARNSEASQFPSGLPHPDGVHRMKNASNRSSLAGRRWGPLTIASTTT
jgi:hypothetical protein